MTQTRIALPPGHRIVSIQEAPDLWRPANEMCSAAWPEFMLHDRVADLHWHRLRDWPAFQLVLTDAAGKIAAASQAAPLHWNGTETGLPEGWDDQLQCSVADVAGGRVTDTLGAIQIVVAAGRRGHGLSALMLDAMRGTAVAAGMHALIACVRPTEKTRYPLLPIETYAAWRRPDGLPFDPWLRVHVRAGGRIVRPSPRSMTVAGSVAEWRQWTGLSFPASGPYWVEGALAPVEIDLATASGTYHDPNVWIIHELTP